MIRFIATLTKIGFPTANDLFTSLSAENITEKFPRHIREKTEQTENANETEIFLCWESKL